MNDRIYVWNQDITKLWIYSFRDFFPIITKSMETLGHKIRAILDPRGLIDMIYIWDH